MYAVIAAAETSNVNAVRADGSFTPSVFPLATKITATLFWPFDPHCSRVTAAKEGSLSSIGENAAGDAPRAAALHGPSRPSPVTTAVHRPDQAAVEQERVSNARRRRTHRHHRIDVGSIEQRRPAQTTREGKAPRYSSCGHAKRSRSQLRPSSRVWKILRGPDATKPKCQSTKSRAIGGAGPPNPPGAGGNRRPPPPAR